MTYPPGSPGYPPSQQPNPQFTAPTQQFAKVPELAPGAAPDGASKLPAYLIAAVTVLGIAVWLSSFAPLLTANTVADLPTPFILDLGVAGAIFAGLLAGVSLVPKQTAANAVVAVLSVLSFLLVIEVVLTAPSGITIEYGLYLLIAFTLIQAIVAVAVLLIESGVITPPAPRPSYDQPQYGQYGGGPYYSQPGGQPGGQQHGGPGQHTGPQGPPQQQRPGYPSQYGGYQSGPSTGGFSALGPQSGTPTPPTGFPTFGQPQGSNAPTAQQPAQQPSQQQPSQQQPSQQQSPSQQSGQAPS
jgi:hypothetical protein